MADDNFDPDALLTQPAPSTASMTVRPARGPLTRDQAEKLVRKYNPDITSAAVSGEVDNLVRESGGKSNAPGDYVDGRPTSFGLYQEHNTRKTGLLAYAKAHDVDASDPDIQVQYARMEKERDYPGLLKIQQTNDDRAANEDAFKRIFERPASVLWSHNADGKPVIKNDRFNFSDAALKEHDDKPDTDLLAMSPQEYLDLAPAVEKPFETPAGRALMKSFNKGEPIDSVPTLDIAVNGPTATVVDQDGRHRALLAQQHGIEAIPVAVTKTTPGTPTEIQGMAGKSQAFDFPPFGQTQDRPDKPTPEPAPAEQPRSIVGQIGDAIIPRAEAAEPLPAWMSNAVPANQQPPAAQPLPEWMSDAVSAGASPPQPAAPQSSGPFDTALAFAKGAAEGFGDTALAGQELVGKGMEALGVPGGQAVTADARTGAQNLQDQTAGDRAAHPWASGIGEFAGGMVLPTVAGRFAGPLGGGAAAGVLTPTGDENYWRDKLIQGGVGAGAGVLTEKAGNALSRFAVPNLKPNVDLLVKEGVQLTPGQVAGGAAKRAEDAAASIPVLGSQIRKAQERSFETFNRAVINRGLEDIGQKLPPGVDSGHDAIGWAQDEFGKAYDQVIPRMAGHVDVDFRNDLNAIYARAQAENLPQQYLDQLQHAIAQHIIEPFRAGGGQIAGDAAQDIGTKLDETINPLRRGGVYEQDLARYLRAADKALDNMMERQNPVLSAAKAKIDKGYAQFKIAQAAAHAAGTRADGTFTPAQLNRAVLARDKSKDKAAYARGIALMQDLSTAAKDVLPQKVPDSGTPERAALMAILGGGFHMEPHTFGALAAASVPYTAPASKVMNLAIERLAQPAGAARNFLATMLRGGGRLAAPAAGLSAGAAAPAYLPGGQPQQ